MNIDFSILQKAVENIQVYSPQLQLAADILTVVIGLSILFALAGLPFIAVTCELHAIIKQRSFYNKCARQIAGIASILSLIAILVGGYLTKIRIIDMQNLTVIEQGYVIWWALLALSGFLIGLYFTLWKSMQNIPVLHQCLALLAGFCSIISMYCILALLNVESQIDIHADYKINNIESLFALSQDSKLWNTLLIAPGITISLAASFAIIWLIIRRTRDDYGRDYYNTMLTWLTRWARNGWVLFWATSLFFLVHNSWYAYTDFNVSMSTQEYIDNAIYLLLWSIPIFIWLLVTRSKTPLRSKIALLIAHFIIMSFSMQIFINITSN